MKYIVLFSYLLVMSFLFSFTQADKVYIIVNKANPIETLSASEVELYWLRKIKKRWPEINKNIRPGDRKSDCEERKFFYDEILKMSFVEVDNYFTQKQNENAEKPQDKLSSDADMIEFVESEVGAIRYVSSKINLEGKNVKVLARF